MEWRQAHLYRQKVAMEITELTGLPYDKAKLAVDTVLASIVKALRNKDYVRIRGFGEFKLKWLETTYPIVWKSHYRVIFKPSRTFLRTL